MVKYTGKWQCERLEKATRQVVAMATRVGSNLTMETRMAIVHLEALAPAVAVLVKRDHLPEARRKGELRRLRARFARMPARARRARAHARAAALGNDVPVFLPLLDAAVAPAASAVLPIADAARAPAAAAGPPQVPLIVRLLRQNAQPE